MALDSNELTRGVATIASLLKGSAAPKETLRERYGPLLELVRAVS